MRFNNDQKIQRRPQSEGKLRAIHANTPLDFPNPHFSSIICPNRVGSINFARVPRTETSPLSLSVSFLATNHSRLNSADATFTSWIVKVIGLLLPTMAQSGAIGRTIPCKGTSLSPVTGCTKVSAEMPITMTSPKMKSKSCCRISAQEKFWSCSTRLGGTSSR